MSTSPQSVVSTLNRYLFADADNVKFLQTIHLHYTDKQGEEKVNTQTTHPAFFRLTFIFKESKHHVDLHLTESHHQHWTIHNITVSHEALPLSELLLVLPRSASLGWPLFRTVEGCITVLRPVLLNDPSCINATVPWQNTAAAGERIENSFTATAATATTAQLDLQLSLIHAALISSRTCTLLNPFPPCFIHQHKQSLQGEAHMKDTQDKLEHTTSSTDTVTQAQLDRIEAAFQQLPPLHSLIKHRNTLQSLPTAVVSLLSCVLSSHCQFASVPVQSDLYTMGSTEAHRQAAVLHHTLHLPDYQFNMIQHHDPHFQQQCQQYGSILVFHGSPTQNWHSIVHHGLQCKSHTKEQTSGAIFGAGIYFSDDLRVSRMFSSVGRAWDKSMMGEKIEIVGLYEIINDPEGVRMQRDTAKHSNSTQQKKKNEEDDAPPENYYVVKDNSYIRLKSLLIWKGKASNAQQQRRSHWMILAYLFLLLVIILSRVDWMWTKKALHRYVAQLRL